MGKRLGNVDVARDLYHRGRRRCPDHGALWTASGKLEGEHMHIMLVLTCARAHMHMLANTHDFNVHAGENGNAVEARNFFESGSQRCPLDNGLQDSD